jgi:enoyl-CoA hydratase
LASEVRLERDGPVARIVIDNPPVNALHPNVAAAILAHVDELDGEPAIRAIVLTGAGRHFVGGGDIGFFRTLTPANAAAYVTEIQRMQNRLGELSQPVIAALNGTALGGGCELAMACDIRIAEEHVMLGAPEVSLGIIPGATGTLNLPRLVGPGRARRLLFTGERISASEALAWGLVDEVVPRGDAVRRGHELAAAIACNAPLAVAAAKRIANASARAAIDERQPLETAEFGALVGTRDFQEGIDAFFAKRPPRFTGQ